MLDARDFFYHPFFDNRVKQHPGFTEGNSGPLLLATHKQTGKKYIVKHTYPHNAANEYVACWLAHRLGIPTPTACLLTPQGPFSSKYVVAISFIEGFTRFEKMNVPINMQDDLIGQFVLNSLIATDDMLQLSATGDHIYSYDFSEAFDISDVLLLKALMLNENIGKILLKQRLDAFRDHLHYVDFDIPGLAKEFNLDPERQKSVMIATARRVLSITDDEINAMSSELRKVYPIGYAAYYEECIHAIKEHVMKMPD